jgi:hypothetical protein
MSPSSSSDSTMFTLGLLYLLQSLMLVVGGLFLVGWGDVPGRMLGAGMLLIAGMSIIALRFMVRR